MKMRLKTLIAHIAVLAMSLIFFDIASAQITWTPLQSGVTLQLYDISCLNRNDYTVVGDSGVILHTRDGGWHWEFQDSKTDDYLRGITHIDEKRAVIVGNNGTILSTSDGGASWVSRNSRTFEVLEGISFSDSLVGHACGSTGAVLRTTDGGVRWEARQFHSNDFLLAIAHPSRDTAFAVGVFGAIRRTIDSGDTWSQMISGTTSHLNDVVFLNTKEGIVAGSDGVILNTTDGGAVWTLREIGSGYALVGIAASRSGNTLVIVGNSIANSIALTSFDRGETWHSQLAPTKLYAVSFADDSTIVAVGYQGAIVKGTISREPMAVNDLPHRREDWVLSCSIYNSHDRNTVTIALNVPGQSLVDLRLFDCLGRLVDAPLRSKALVGMHQFPLALHDVVPGVYYYQLSAIAMNGERRMHCGAFLVDDQ